MSDLFASAAERWTARPRDPNDVFLSQVVRQGPQRARVALLGVPFDGAVLGRPGARLGPDAVREELAKLKPWTLARDETTLDVADWGNVRVPERDVPAAHGAIGRAMGEVLATGALPVTLGGDHSITYALVTAVAARDPTRRLGVVNLDAHLDVRDVVAGALNSGQSFGRLLEAGTVRGENLVEVGIRDFANAPRYAEKARKAGATIIGADAWRDEGPGAIDRAIAAASDGTDAVYLSVDLDVLDQAEAPGVSAPTPGGVSTRDLQAAIRRIASRCRLAGADFVEVAPPLDRDGITARAAAYAVATLLAAL